MVAETYGKSTKNNEEEEDARNVEFRCGLVVFSRCFRKVYIHTTSSNANSNLQAQSQISKTDIQELPAPIASGEGGMLPSDGGSALWKPSGD